MKIGYTRTSTKEQDASYQDQIDRLTAAGCHRVFADKISGKTMDRPEFQKALEFLRPGDQLVGTKLDRMFRNLKDTLDIHDGLMDRGIHIVVLDLNIDTATPIGRMMMQVVAAVAELEPNMMRERQAVGITAAREAGKYAKTHRGWKSPVRTDRGPQNKMRAEYVVPVLRYARMTRSNGKPLHSYDDIADLVGCARATVHRILSDAGLVKSRAPQGRSALSEAAE